MAPPLLWSEAPSTLHEAVWRSEMSEGQALRSLQALAEILGCRLVTLDRRLRRGANRLGLVVTPGELGP